MQTTSALYKQLLSKQGHTKQPRVVIDGVIYDYDNIISLSTYGGAFNKFSVGNCVSREIDLTIFPQGTIPKMAKIVVYVRLTDGTQYSEWVEKGTYFIDTRSTDERTGALTIHGYDSILKAEQLWAGNINAKQTTVVSNIASRIGVTVDSRTSLNTSYTVPSDDNYTMREVLGYIGACNAGNWVITDTNTLLLIKLGDIPAETSFLVDDVGFSLLFGEVRIIV